MRESRENPTSIPPEQESGVGEISETAFVAQAVDYALSAGWVKKEQEQLLVEKYLRPIFAAFEVALSELDSIDEVTPEEKARVKARLITCLEATRRVGSTDPQNIIRSIEVRRDEAPDIYTEHVLTSFLEDVAHIVNQ